MTYSLTKNKWAVKWRSGPNNVDGKVSEHFIPRIPGDVPSIVFDTRRAARAWAKERYGYIAARRDLRRYPHDWRSPVVVRVTITIEEISE